MKVYDCNISYGYSVAGVPYKLCETFQELSGEMKNAGISGGLIRATATDTTGVIFGNTRVANDIKDSELDVWGVWGLVPSFTSELPSPEKLPAVMAENKIGALYMNPQAHQYLAYPSVMRDYMKMAEDRKIPLLFNTGLGLSIKEISDLLEAFPKLTCILCFKNAWPSGRVTRPFLSLYPNLHLDTAYLVDDQGIEDIVKDFGAERIIHGSSFPSLYIGAQMANVCAADISESDKEAIFSGNLERILKGADLK